MLELIPNYGSFFVFIYHIYNFIKNKNMEAIGSFFKKYGLWLLFSGVVVAWTLAYFCKFHEGLSSDNADWGTFGDYFNALTGIINLGVLSFLTYLIHKETKTMEKPVLTFTYDKSENQYSCMNIGKGSALNIAIINKLNENDSTYDKVVYCFSLPANQSIPIHWINGTAEFVVLYEDILHNEHGVRFMNNTLEVVQKSDLKKWGIEKEAGKITKIFGQSVIDDYQIYDAPVVASTN